MITTLLHVRMRVSNMEETLRFYTEIIGLSLVEQHQSPRGSKLAFLSVPKSDTLIELCEFSASGPVQVQEDLVHLAFEVNNMEDTLSALKAKNIPITDGPTKSASGSQFIFIDAPDGYEIELIARAKKTG